MKHFRVVSVLVLSNLLVGIMVPSIFGQNPSAVQRGKYILQAAGGCSCHTDFKNQGAALAGARPIKTPFGKVYSTNITPDPKTGIGKWSDADFITAMRKGVSPKGAHYFPVFPYTSFTQITDKDMLDLKAYLFSLPPVEQENKPPDMTPPFGWRFVLVVWKWLYFQPGSFQPDPTQSPEWNRGAYLSNALGHCAECHTPRNFMGGQKAVMYYAGSADGPEGQLAPNITPDEETGIEKWSIPDMVWFLQTGLKPDGNDAQGLMREVIENGLQYLTEADLQAIAVYLRSLKPVHNKVVAK
jgi:mono/diheme cytochrome c family protein